MSAGSLEKYSLQNENTSENITAHKIPYAEEGKGLTFKDWKTIKEGETRSKTLNKQTISNDGNKARYTDNRKNNAAFSVNHQGNEEFPPCYSSVPKSFYCVNNFGMRGNYFRTLNNSCYNPLNNFGFTNFNGFGMQCNFKNNNNSDMLNNFNYQHASHFINGGSLHDNFFASDGIYRQRDLMQKPLPHPFKQDVKVKQLLQNNNEKKKKEGCGNVQSNTTTIPPSTVNKISTMKTSGSLEEESKIYVTNPSASKDGKVLIPKPKLLEGNIKISKEEKKQQWKEYREAMKPFKNREFYNAKRVVQRLGKKDIKDLDEKELFRLTNAREVMAAHKARLTAKYSDYVKAEGESNELGEIYVLKKPVLKDREAVKARPKKYQNYSNVRETHLYSIMEPGRKILGGCSGSKGFVPGSMSTTNGKNLIFINTCNY